MATGQVNIVEAARAYVRNGGISIAQAYLKHSLVPLPDLIGHLPNKGTILDLGCGEGILTNLVARSLPDCNVVGYDLDVRRIEIASKNSAGNASFERGDIFNLPERQPVDGIIINDVVHHHLFSRHRVILSIALRMLRPGGSLVLKEVDALDKPDLIMTRFFDSRLYPQDTLCFRTAPDWLSLLRRLGVKDVTVRRVKHLWPASRTLFFIKRPVDADLNIDVHWLAAIGAANYATDTNTTTVFVTGASGFVGGHLARYLLNHGLGGKKIRLILLARDRYRVPADIAAKAFILLGDLNDLPSVRAALAGVDYVFHLAAEVKIAGDKSILWRTNYGGTVDLIEALRGLQVKRLVYASTMGAVDRAPSDPCNSPLDESAPPHPLSEYGQTKLKAEEAVISSGLPFSIVRIAWGYGSGMTPDTHVRYLVQGVGDGKLFSRFNFPGKVSILAVDDLVNALILVADRDEARNQIYYASDGRALSLGDLFRRAGSVIGRRAAFIGIPIAISAIARAARRFLPLQLQNLNSHVLWVDNSKLVALGFKPKVAQRQGLSFLAQDIGLIPHSDRRLISLVTGAASGIGLALAEQLHHEGHRLLLVDIDEPALSSAAARLEAEYLALDLSRASSIEAIDRFLAERSLQLDWLINCAGVGVRGAVADIDGGREDLVIQLNSEAVIRLSRLAIRHFRAAGRGTLINIASSAGFQPLPFMAVYAASKSFVQTYTRSLAGEIREQPGVQVMLVNPSGTATAFQRVAGVKTSPWEKQMAPQDVARRIVSASYERKLELTIGRRAQAMQLLARFLPIRIQVLMWAKLMNSLR